jgi:hypothetical protein
LLIYFLCNIYHKHGGECKPDVACRIVEILCRNWANKCNKYYSFGCFILRSQTLEEDTMSSMTLPFGTFNFEINL